MAGSAGDSESRWRRTALGSRATLYQVGAEKFKTCALRVYLHAPLALETVTATALVPHLLGRGCRGYPDLTAIHRRLEHLYGAGVGAGATKRGETQSLFLGLDVVQGRYLPEDVLPAAVDLLGRMCREPALDALGSFPPETVRQEKEHMDHRIRGILNDKARYAALRCVQAMCGDEPYALSALGRLEDLPQLSAGEVTERWRALLASSPVDIFAVGGGPELAGLLQTALGPLVEGAAEHPATPAGPVPASTRRVTEFDAVQQAKLCLGYRTAVRRTDPGFAAMLLYSGILGGFPHSKLFRHVREEASLAYYVFTQWDAVKGVLLIQSGIEADRLEQALEIIGRQVADMAQGRIDADEMEFTKRGLAHQLQAAEDEPGSLLDSALGQALAADLRPVRERVAEIEALTVADVAAVAHGVALDTIYCLRPEEAASA